jgi:hypothetical protein
MRRLFIFLVLAASISNAALAQYNGLISRSQNGVVFVSGGVAEDQREAMQIMRPDFNLQLTFAARGSGEYYANVKVNVDSESGIKFVRAVSEGPIFLAKFAPGDYQVTATLEGVTQTKKVTIGKTGVKDLYFYW